MASSSSEKPYPVDRVSEDLRYPIGPYSPPLIIRRAERDAWIAALEALPANLRNAAAGLVTASWTSRTGLAVGRSGKLYTIFPTVT